jgi:hypothetical protein
VEKTVEIRGLYKAAQRQTLAPKAFVMGEGLKGLDLARFFKQYARQATVTPLSRQAKVSKTLTFSTTAIGPSGSSLTRSLVGVSHRSGCRE